MSIVSRSALWQHEIVSGLVNIEKKLDFYIYLLGSTHFLT